MSLILSTTPLGMFSLGGGERPGVAVTYMTRTGEICRAGTLKTGLSCRIRYEIDISDHRDNVDWPVPSKDERNFRARIGVGWRVYDPCEVTRRQLKDGFQVIHSYLLTEVRRKSREHPIEQRHQLEDEINQLVPAHAPARFPEGLEVFHLAATFSSDELTVNHAATIRTLDWESAVAQKEHTAELSRARSQIDIDALRRDAVEQMVAGENGLLLHHLTIHRDDTMGVLRVLQEQNQLSTQARERLLSDFKDHLLPEELAGLAEQLVIRMRESLDRPERPQLIERHEPPAVVPGSTIPTPDSVETPTVPAEPPAQQGNGAPNSHPDSGGNVAEWRPLRSDPR